LDGIEIISPQRLLLEVKDKSYLVITTSMYHKEIKLQLDELGINNYKRFYVGSFNADLERFNNKKTFKTTEFG